jgi:hypothetical protein
MLSPKQSQHLRRFANGGDFDSDEAFYAALRKLETAEELHYLAQILNWDDYRTEKALGWILDHPKCDAGTALQIYWLNQPVDIYDSVLKGSIPKWQEDAYKLHKKIEKSYLAGKFSTRRFAFDPSTENYEATSPAAQAIPQELKSPISGLDLGEFYDHYKL